MKVLVTGGTGYIGSHTIVALLEAGYEVINVDNLCNSEEFIHERIRQITGREFTFIHADVRDYNWMIQALQEAGPIEAILHFAALKSVPESVEKPLLYYDNNLYGMINVLKLLQALKIPKLVFSSSCTVYGQPEALPVTESSPFLPAQSPYGYTKQVCETLIQNSIPKMKGANGVSLRYFNPIGAHPSGLIGELPKGVPNNLVPYITQTAIGKREVLNVYGADYDTPDGSCIRDYIHVSDLAIAHVAALEYLNRNKNMIKVTAFNVGTGKGTSVLEAVKAFENATGVKLNYKISPRRSGDIDKIWADATTAENYLQWKAKYSIEEAMEHAWKWEKNLYV